MKMSRARLLNSVFVKNLPWTVEKSIEKKPISTRSSQLNVKIQLSFIVK